MKWRMVTCSRDIKGSERVWMNFLECDWWVFRTPADRCRRQTWARSRWDHMWWWGPSASWGSWRWGGWCRVPSSRADSWTAEWCSGMRSNYWLTARSTCSTSCLMISRMSVLPDAGFSIYAISLLYGCNVELMYLLRFGSFSIQSASGMMTTSSLLVMFRSSCKTYPYHHSKLRRILTFTNLGLTKFFSSPFWVSSWDLPSTGAGTSSRLIWSPAASGSALIWLTTSEFLEKESPSMRVLLGLW